MHRGAWRATVHGVTKSQTQVSNYKITTLVEPLASRRKHQELERDIFPLNVMYLYTFLFTVLSISTTLC